MHVLHTLGLGLGLALASIGSAQAAPVVGSGGGYFGTADYGNGAGSVVGPYTTWAACNAALQAAINNAVNNFGYTVTAIHPCSYTPPFSGVMHVWFELKVPADTPRESGAVAATLLDEVRRLRETHRADAYESMIGGLVRIVDPDEDEDFDKDANR